MKTEILEKLEKLPIPLQNEVESFVDFLIFKDQQKEKANSYDYDNNRKTNDYPIINEPGFEKPKLKREAGGLKGKIWMADDFDEPLEEFKDYR